MPKFVLDAHASPHRAVIFHTERPRFCLEFHSGGEGEFLPVDEAPEEVLSALRGQAREMFEEGRVEFYPR